ncbi:conserved Plasmodium protein, unknown function [Plasmodium knowlesi strain H]|uniref:Uncharacterized protein n=3 Tax=Plasmodium knowlesi TaxID=5850 RepID=A0A5K1U809_PLAKH|nr:conserved Plasmodium protein, unknown function [Plasmodium knowlesi strain H]OTN65058.1 Uncharacterized protein PKNOH_S120156200 [Plasmodium knowlesi]CAA9988418.1 conserved Plasmodium protein, unknown function [Plasmodium knowlesi strain H]SBO19895.1 conserved Plasmodium protein, unknown function [Plasmodium knowlesi strain H]SBO20396.1 conserved Plasmodium protein, unknown function [Plasmodium knowlesi strain H]VVS77892.1 conserved Plasmodium protein, unknown function [Plasmodium knowlesi |eukprot:XP_002259399.1 hypothetical protein, conserved in Plasmodium species [Plasmodium knowlesi strain H]
MKALRIDMLSTDSDLSESNFYLDGQERDFKKMEKKNTNCAMDNPDSDVDSDKEYFIDCFEGVTKAIPNGGKASNENGTTEEGKRFTGDNPAGDNGEGNNAACSYGDDDLRGDLENFQSFDLSSSDMDDKRFEKKEKFSEQYKINIITESDISLEEEKCFRHSMELSDNADEVQCRQLNLYADESNDKPLGCAAKENHSLHPGKDATNKVGEMGDSFERTDKLTRKKYYSNEEECEGTRENHWKNELEMEEEINVQQMDTDAGEQDGENESGNDTKFVETEKTVEDCDMSERGVNFNYKNITFKKEQLNKMSLTNQKRHGFTEGRGRPVGKFPFVLVGGVRKGNPLHKCAQKADKLSDKVEEVDIAGKVDRVTKVERKPKRFDQQRKFPFRDYYSTKKNEQNGEWEKKQDHQTTDELITSSAYEKSDTGDSLNSEPENGTENEDDLDDGKFNHYKHQNFFSKERGPKCLPQYGKRSNKQNKSVHPKFFLKSPLIRKQFFSEASEQCKRSEIRNAPNKKADHESYMCRQKSGKSRKDFNNPNCYIPPKRPNFYGKKLYEHEMMKAPKSVSKRTVGVQINLRAKKEYKKRGNTKSELSIQSYRRVKVKIPVFELKQAEIKNYDFDAVLVKDGRVVPRKKDPIQEFLRAYISYINQR